MSPETSRLRTRIRLACSAHAPAHTHRGWSQSEDAVGGFRSLLRLCIIKRPHTHSDTPRTPGTEGAHPGPKQRPAPTARPRVRLAALVPQQDSRAAARFSRIDSTIIAPWAGFADILGLWQHCSSRPSAPSSVQAMRGRKACEKLLAVAFGVQEELLAGGSIPRARD